MNLENFFNKRLELKKNFKNKEGQSYNQASKESPSNTYDDIDALLGGDNTLKDLINTMYAEGEERLSFSELKKKVEQARTENEKLSAIKTALQTLKHQEERLLQKRYEYAQASTGTSADDILLKKLDLAEQKIHEKKTELLYGAETWKYARMAQLSSYKDQLSKGFVQTPSRTEAMLKMSELLAGGSNIFLEGDSGTGKTELLKNLVQITEGYTPEVFGATDQSRDSEIYGKTGLTGKDGATQTVFTPGMLVRSIIDGKKVIFDEFNNMDQSTRLGLKKYYNLKPGDKFTVPQDGDNEFEVGKGFGFLATGNLPSDKHPDRKPLGNEEIREFKMPHLDHLPKEEVYDLLITAAMREDATVPFSKQEAESTFKHVTEAIKEVHNAYEGMGSFYNDVVKKEKAILKKAVLDPKEYMSWIQGYKYQTAQSLQEYLAHKITEFISKGSFPEDDKNLLFKIFATKGLLHGIDPTSFNIETSEAQALGWQGEAPQTQSLERNLSLEDVATLDPFGVREQRMQSEVDDFITKNSEHTPRQEVGTDIEEALEIMGESQFIGPDDIENTFGFTPENVPEVPFSPEELERARELGQQLILYVDTKADGTPFTMEDMIPLDNKTSDGKVFLYNKDNDGKDQDGNWLYKDTEAKLRSETPRLGWRLTTPEIIEGSTDKNYLEQIETLIGYLKKEHFKGVDIPKTYEEAIDEFNNEKDAISALMKSDWQAAAKKLSELSINQLTRERSSEIIYRLAINEKKLGVKNLAYKYSWSISLEAGGKLVDVGPFDGDGLRVDGWGPGSSDGDLGLCFSAGIRG